MTARSEARYEMLFRLAAGGMGTVSLARMRAHGGFERLVAVKTCHEVSGDDVDLRKDFLLEAQRAATVRHPNVVATFDVVEDRSELLVVMEYVEGVTAAQLLRGLMQASKQAPIAIVLRIVVDVLAGLGAAHALTDAAGTPLELVHRDVSPQNVLVGTDGVSRLLDFGIAKSKVDTTAEDGGLRGKLGYLAPELLQGAPHTQATDLYGMAVVLWELLAGRRLFNASSEAEALNLNRFADPPRLSRLREDVPPALEEIVRRALGRDASQRYHSASDLLEALEAIGAPVASAREVGAFVLAAHSEMLLGRRERLKTALGEASARDAAAPKVESQSAIPTLMRGEWAPAAAFEGAHAEVTQLLPMPTPAPTARVPRERAGPSYVPWFVVGSAVLSAVIVGGWFLLFRSPSPSNEIVGALPPPPVVSATTSTVMPETPPATTTAVVITSSALPVPPPPPRDEPRRPPPRGGRPTRPHAPTPTPTPVSSPTPVAPAAPVVHEPTHP